MVFDPNRPIPFMHHHEEIARKVARHEMGHYVVATVLGFRTGDVTLRLIGMDGHHGGTAVTLARSLRTLEDVGDHLERRVQILYAGAIAETLKPFSPDKSVDEAEAIAIIDNPKGAEQDKAKAVELILLLRNLRHPDTSVTEDAAPQAEVNAINDALWQKTVTLVETYRDDILGLAGNLAQRATHTNQVFTLTDAELSDLKAVQRLRSIGEHSA